MSFPCHGCGACCMSMGKILSLPKDFKTEFRDLIDAFPYAVKDNGWCEQLGDDMKCNVYKSRPHLCKIDLCYHTHFSSMSKKDYYDLNIATCKALMADKLLMTSEEITEFYDTI